MNRAERRAAKRQPLGQPQPRPARLLHELDRAVRARLAAGESREEAAAALAEFIARTTDEIRACHGERGLAWIAEQIAERRRRLLAGGDPA